MHDEWISGKDLHMSGNTIVNVLAGTFEHFAAGNVTHISGLMNVITVVVATALLRLNRTSGIACDLGAGASRAYFAIVNAGSSAWRRQLIFSPGNGVPPNCRHFLVPTT